MNLLDHIPSISDFPKKGVKFRDVSPLLADPSAFSFSLKQLGLQFSPDRFDVIAGIESRGFIFGSALAHDLGKPFVMIRKANKLPPETIRVSYELEYGSDHLEIRKNILKKEDRVLIVDDVLATGGTLLAARDLIQKAGAKPIGALTLLEIGFLEGAKRLTNGGLEIKSLLKV